jgi:hypothetical protein
MLKGKGVIVEEGGRGIRRERQRQREREREREREGSSKRVDGNPTRRAGEGTRRARRCGGGAERV